MAGLPLRTDYDGAALRGLARRCTDADQVRRLLSLAAIYDGGSRAAAATVGGVGRQIVRDWVEKFNAFGPAGLVTRHAPGPRPRLEASHREALVKLVEAGPDPAVHGVVRWRLKDLVVWLGQQYGLTLDETTLGRTLKALGYAKLSARPRHHAQVAGAIEDFKKASPPQWRPSRPTSRPRP